MRGKRYNGRGECIGTCGPLKRVDPVQRDFVKRSEREAAKMGPPVETLGFDLERFQPLPTRLLLKRPPFITQEKGVDLPEEKWRHELGWVVVKVGTAVEGIRPGDRIVLPKKHRPAEIWLGGVKYYMGRGTAVVAVLEEQH